MNSIADSLNWIDLQRDRMIELVTRWSSINSGTYNAAGLKKLAGELDKDFAVLGGERRWIDLPPDTVIDNRGTVVLHPLGQALHIVQKRTSKPSVFLGIHYDTVYGADDPFQKVRRDRNTLHGPGVIDAKGGLAVLLIALQAFEQSVLASELCWEVLINPDEEVGSPGSSKLLAEFATRNVAGLVFEPSLPDGAMVDVRKGSGNYSIIVRGRSAHAGRDFHAGRNAVVAAAEIAVQIHRHNSPEKPVTLNVARIDGGGAVNVVPNLAVVRVNARASQPEHVSQIEASIREIVESVSKSHEVTASIEGHFSSMPKVLDAKSSQLKSIVESSASKLGMTLTWKPSGGASDGNKLSAVGLPVIDTFGPRGGSLHSPDEYLLVDSLTERAKLALMTLFSLSESENLNAVRNAAGSI